MLMKLAAAAAGVAVVNGLELDADKNRPVSKVITLLKDMQKQLEKEGEDDEAIYDKMACWCKTNDAEKTKAIEEAEQRIAELTASIEEGTAKSSSLTAEIKNLEKEVAANQAALDKATALRQKQLAEFNEEEKDLLQSIQALKNAVTVLSKHNKSFVQMDASEGGASASVAHVMQHAFKKHSKALLQVITPSQHASVQQFIQAALAGKADAPAYANQSGEIFGILGNMKDTFEANLSQSQKEEMANQKAYEDLKAAKEAEIGAGQEQIDTKTDELAATDEKLAQDKQDKEDTENSLSADEKYLMNLKEKCQQTDAEWEQRQKTRTNEIAAVSEALKFLSSDDAHDLFTRTFNFVQVTVGQKAIRNRAAAVIESVSATLDKPRMSALAQSVRLDAFTKVKKAIDDMVSALLKEKADEIKHKDFCVDSLHQNEKDTTEQERNKSDLIAKIDELDARIKSLASAIEDLQAQIAEAQVQLKRAGEDREKMNLEFQTTVQDQRATQKLLTQALNVLKSFYEKGAKGVALNQQEPAGPPPPAGFKSYNNNAGGSGVVAMITQIINDAKAAEAEAVHDENDAQAAYEEFVQGSNASIKAKSEEIINKQEAKGNKEQDLTAAEADLEDVKVDLEQLGNEKTDLHSQCDFFIKNFDVRQEAQTQEVEALQQAKAILSGADPDLD
jgi:septal ring factor EnvC (AmiA/AmiB activator)